MLLLGSRARTIALAGLAGAAMLSGCSPFLEREPLPDRPRISAADAGATEQALRYLDDTRLKAEGARDNRVLIDTVANSGIIVGAAGAAVAAAYGASTNLIVGFLLGGSASYVGGQLYGDRGYIEIYGNLIEALDCVDEEARKAYEPVRPIRNARRAVGAATDRLQSKYIGIRQRMGDRTDIEDELAVKLAEAAGMLEAARRALNRADDYLMIEYGLADAIVGAVNRVVAKGNDQIRQRRPDADAFARAVGLLSATAALKNANQIKEELEKLRNAPVGGAARSPNDNSGASPKVQQSPRDAAWQTAEANELGLLIAEVRAAVPFIPLDLDRSTGTARTALTGCKIGDSTVVALTVSPSGDVKLRKGQTVTLVSSGGLAPYDAVWIGEEPGKAEVGRDRAFRSVTLTGMDKMVAGKTYVLRIVDSGQGAPAFVDIKVVTE